MGISKNALFRDCGVTDFYAPRQLLLHCRGAKTGLEKITIFRGTQMLFLPACA
jgi:hypothetical protein